MNPYDSLKTALLALKQLDWPQAPAVGEAPPPPSVVGVAAGLALALYAEKNPGYGDSWAHRGAQGIFHNVARKFDRLEHSVVRANELPRPDDVVDLAAYAIMQLGWHLYNRPMEMEAYFGREGLPLR